MYWLAFLAMPLLGLALLKLIAASDISRSKRAAISSLRAMFKENGISTAVANGSIYLRQNSGEQLKLTTNGFGRPTSWATLSGTLSEIGTAEIAITLVTVFLLEVQQIGELQLKFAPQTVDTDFVYTTLVTKVSSMEYGEHTVEEILGVFLHLEIKGGQLLASIRKIRLPLKV
jgi:hypothetical protein